MNAQQQATVLFVAIATSNSKKERKELLRGQFLFEAVVNGVVRHVTHGEFFGAGHPPFEGVVTTKAGVAARDIEGGMLFIPAAVEVVAPAAVEVVAPAAVEVVAPAAVEVVAPAAVEVVAPALLTTRTTRVAFGEEVVIWNGTFTEKLSVIAPSSGAIIEERFKDGTNKITFVGSIRQTWTI